MTRADRTGSEGGRLDWRDTVIAASGVNIVAGLWLIASPFVLGHSDDDALWNPIVVGAAVGLVAGVRVAGALPTAPSCAGQRARV